MPAMSRIMRSESRTGSTLLRGELIHVRLFEAALCDPRRAEAQAGRVERGLVAGDGVAVDDDSGDVEDARGEVAHERRAVGTNNGFTI